MTGPREVLYQSHWHAVWRSVAVGLWALPETVHLIPGQDNSCNTVPTIISASGALATASAAPSASNAQCKHNRKELHYSIEAQVQPVKYPNKRGEREKTTRGEALAHEREGEAHNIVADL